MEDRLHVLELVERGEISADEGIRRLEALLDGRGRPEEPPANDVPAAAPAEVVRPIVVRVVSQVVFWFGVALLVGGGLLVSAVYAWDFPTFGLAWGGVLLGLGVLVTVLGWWLQRARWLSLRVRDSDGQGISFALPLPLGLMAGALRIARPFAPQLKDTGVDELVLALKDEVRRGEPLVVEVKEGDGGEQVQFYVG